MTIPAADGAVSTSSREDAESWLRCYAPVENPILRLIAFPHAGGAASAFLVMARTLADHRIEVHAVQYPGRQDRRREPFAESVQALADSVAFAIRHLSHQSSVVPYALFGHSFGAIIAFETARALESASEPPILLIPSGRRAPDANYSRDVRHLQNDAELIKEIERLEGTQVGLLDDLEIRELVLPALRNDFLTAAAYRLLDPRPLAIPITVFIGDRDPGVPVDEVLHWRRCTSSAFASRVFPGGHFYLDQVASDVCAALADALRDALAAFRPVR